MRLSSTSSSNRGRAFGFVLRGLVFLLPVALFVGIFEVIFWRSGDAWPIDWVVREQLRDPRVLYGRGYFSQQFNVYKLAMWRALSPDILVVGSSRVMQFRAITFHPLEDRFYNAGGLLQGLEDTEHLAQLIVSGEVPKPKVLIVGIDFWWLIEHRSMPSWLSEARRVDAAVRLSGHVNAIKSWAKQRRPFSMESPRRLVESALEEFWLWSSPRRSRGAVEAASSLGFRAIGIIAAKGTGFRADGSRFIPGHVFRYLREPGYSDGEQPKVVERARQGIRQFEPGNFDSGKLDRLERALFQLQRHGVEVFTFIPPVATEVDTAASASTVDKSWWNDFHEKVPAGMRSVGIPCHAVRSPLVHGLSDEYMLDGFHPSEVFLTWVVEGLIESSRPDSLLRDVELRELLRLREEAPIPLAFELPPGAVLSQ